MSVWWRRSRAGRAAYAEGGIVDIEGTVFGRTEGDGGVGTVVGGLIPEVEQSIG